jgi:deoxyribonuclease-1
MVHARTRAVAAFAACLAGACAGPDPGPAPLASFEARPLAASDAAPAPGSPCGAEGAPPRPETHDERSVAQALTWVWRDDPVENYCGCRFGADQSVGPDCGYAGDDAAPPVIRWEPVVPPSRFGVYRRCWQRWSVGDGVDAIARRKCAEVDEEFRAMEADLYNYHPVLAALSERRGDHPFARVQGEPRDFGSCDFETQSVMGKTERIEPPPEVLGDLARVYLYMAGRYGKGRDWKIKLTREQRQLYEKWSEADPVDDRERLRACRIQAIQGWENPYVK